MSLYEYDLSDEKSWCNYNAPYLDPRIPIELLKIGGTNHRGQPRLRAVWGGSEETYYEGDEGVERGWHLKYFLCFTPADLRGYEYTDRLTGQKRRVSTHVALPDDVIVEPLYYQEEIGKPRWIIEIWRDAGDCGGFFKQEGYYHLLTVQKEPVSMATGMGPYREIDSDVTQAVKGMYHFTENTTEAQREAMRAEDEREAKELAQKAKDAVWEDSEETERIIYEHAV